MSAAKAPVITSRRVWIPLAIATALVLAVLLSHVPIVYWRSVNNQAEQRFLTGARVGATEQMVLDKLGPPWSTATDAASLSNDIIGYEPKPLNPIIGKVLVYKDAAVMLLVYLDKASRVEAVHILYT